MYDEEFLLARARVLDADESQVSDFVTNPKNRRSRCRSNDLTASASKGLPCSLCNVSYLLRSCILERATT